MNLQEIRVSGLLEQYAIGATNEDEEKIVQKALNDFPQLKNDLDSIIHILRAYNAIELKEVPEDLKQKVLNAMSEAEPHVGKKRNVINSNKKAPTKTPTNELSIPWIQILSLIAGILAISSIGLYIFKNGQIKKLDKTIVELNNNLEEKNVQLGIATQAIDSLSELSNPDNEVYILKPSLRYAATSMYVVKSVDNNYYAKINSLPELSAGREFKLWSINVAGAYERLPIPIESLSAQFLSPIDLPLGAQTIILSVHRIGNEAPPTRSLIMGRIDLE